MLTEFKIPEVGENITSGTAVKINVTVGESVKKDQSLLELETDKATIEVPSSVAGIIKEILIKSGDKVNVGQVVFKIDGGATGSTKEPAATETKTSTPAKPATEKTAEKSAEKVSSSAPAPAQKAPAPEQQAPETANVSAAAPAPAQQAPTPKASQPAATPAVNISADVAAAPSVRRLARELGLNVSEVPSTDPSGRISKEDVKAHAKRLLTTGSPAVSGSTGVAAPPLPDFTKYGEVERKPMNNIRKKTAEHLSHAWTAIPHVTQFDKADITNLEKLRKQFSKPERKLSITPFLMKVIAAALKNFPQFNSSVDMATGEIIQKKYFNIGIAVDTPNGLVVPVLRDVEKKTILQLSEELNTMAEKAREKKLSIEDMRGGSFTISNLGGIGGTNFSPIVNWPEVAILGVARGQMEPKYASNGQFVPALMLPLALSYDHRVIDGADGARFLRWICDAIEQPFLMELN